MILSYNPNYTYKCELNKPELPESRNFERGKLKPVWLNTGS